MPRVLTGAVMEISGEEDEMAVLALEAAMTEREEGEICDEATDSPSPAAPEAEATSTSDFPSKWVAASSHALIAAAQGTAPSLQCNLCGAEFNNRKRLRIHARVHYVQCLCPCGFNSKWRESVRSHQKDDRNSCSSKGPVYEVDSQSFASWQRTFRTPLSSYPGEIPTRVVDATSAPTRATPASTSTATTSTASPAAHATSRSSNTNSKGRKHHSGSKSARDRPSTSCARTDPPPRARPPPRSDARDVIRQREREPPLHTLLPAPATIDTPLRHLALLPPRLPPLPHLAPLARDRTALQLGTKPCYLDLPSDHVRQSVSPSRQTYTATYVRDSCHDRHAPLCSTHQRPLSPTTPHCP